MSAAFVLSRRRAEAGRRAVPFLLLFALTFLRWCCCGLSYFPQLDDYIQLHNYAAYYGGLWQVVEEKGLLASRPLAGVLDVALWSRFWPHLLWAVALICALYAAAGLLYRRVWGAYFGTGWLFLVLFALLPLGSEGTYWLSASVRVVPAVFFSALSARLFQRWCTGGRWWLLAACALAQLLCFGFYEQGLALCVTGVVLVAVLEFPRAPRRALGCAVALPAAALYFAFTAHFSQSAVYSGRTGTLFPWQENWTQGVLTPALKQMRTAFSGLWPITFRGARRGWALVVGEGRWAWLLLTLALTAALFFLVARAPGERGPSRPARRALPLALGVGALLFLAPLSVFLILRAPWFSLRGTVCSFCGLALAADALAGALLRRAGARRWIYAGLCAALCLLFSLSAAGEVGDYRRTYEDDRQVLSAVLAGTDGGRALPQEGVTALLGVEGSWLEEENFRFHEHIHGVTESDWALNGALQCAAGRLSFPKLRPLPASTGAQAILAGEYAAVWGYDRPGARAVPLTLESRSDGTLRLYTADGALWGSVTDRGLSRPGKDMGT